MNNKTFGKPTARGKLLELFTSLADGDVRTLSLKDVNVSSLRARAGQLNGEAGFTKYRISVDSFMGVVRIANNV